MTYSCVDSLSIDPCNLCPRQCGAHRLDGKRGACGADHRMMIARAALHYWEEPPLSGSSGSGTVFFSYCPLQCIYCQNATIAAGKVGWKVSVLRLAEICLGLQDQGALNINFVTPTHYSLPVRHAVTIAREKGLSLPIVWNTSGYERVEVIDALADTVNIWLTDYKYADSSLACAYSHAADYPEISLTAIEEMVKQTGEPKFNECEHMQSGVIVRHLVLPHAYENSCQSLKRLWECFGNSVLYSIMNQYTPVIEHPVLGQTVSTNEYEAVLDFADSLGLCDYFWQDSATAMESFIPTWDGEGIFF